MGKTSISWCHYTFNLWWGCFKISPGCQNCYAAAFDRRVTGKDTDHWDRTGSRRFMGEEYWLEPLKWNEKARREGTRFRVFCGSMCDWAEKHPNPVTNAMMNNARRRLFELIMATPYLDWLLLTKRPENAAEFLPWKREPWTNVWLGTTAEDQEHADKRFPILLKIPAVIHFGSLEPLLGPIELTHINQDSVFHADVLAGMYLYPIPTPMPSKLDWAIMGAESGHRARRCDPEWLRAIRDDCVAAGTAVFLKQAVWQQPITIGLGSKTKGKGYGRGDIVELPYLDGKQWAQVPEVRHAA